MALDAARTQFPGLRFWREASARLLDPERKDAVALTRHRRDIQGLRAVAVLLVALDHAGVSFLRGGYVGVDVFFVLSGFLITGLLLSEAVERQSVSLVNFYVRRARRILPAAALTLVVTDIVAYRLLNIVRAKQAVLDSYWAALFTANIHFAQQGTDYFARIQPPSPVLHFWTLAVEEQFYVVWPVVLVVVLFAGAFRRRLRGSPIVDDRAVRRLLIVVVMAAVASLAWSIHDTGASPFTAYFSTFTRAWELALGAALAIGTPGLMRLTASVRAAMGWLGLAAIGIAAMVYSGSTPFPGSAALLPTVGAALVIAAGISQTQHRLAAGRLLAISPLRYVGDRSYGFYLWHWPVLIIAGQYEGHQLSVGVKLLLLLGAFLITIVTYALVENPIRRAKWSVRVSAMLWPASVGAVVLVAAVTLQSIYSRTARLEAVPASTDAGLFAGSPSTASPQPGGSRQALAAVKAGRSLPVVVAAVKAARGGAAVPRQLVPPPAELTNHEHFYFFPGNCAPQADSQTTSDICRLGDPSARRSIAVIGDSHAEMWMPGILSFAQHNGWVVRPLVKSGCTPPSWLGGGTAACRAWYTWAVRRANLLHPDVTLITASTSGAGGTSAEVIKEALFSLANAVKHSSGKVMIVEDAPGISQSPVDCLLSPHAKMSDCTTTRSADWFYMNDDIAALARADGLGYISTRAWFCFKDQCPLVLGHTIAYVDAGHLTKEYALQLASPFRVAFNRALGRARAR